MPVFYVKWKIYEVVGSYDRVYSKAFSTLQEAMKFVLELVIDYGKDVDEWEDSASTTGEYIVDLFGYGKKENFSVTLELTKMEREP